MVKASASRAADPGFDSRFGRRDFSRSSHTSHLKTGIPVTTCQAPGVTRSALGRVGRVSVYFDRDRLVGLMVRRPPRERKIPGSNPACDGIFSGSSHTSDSKIGTPVATLPGAWRYRVSAGTGRTGVSIL